jgi:hypothetical protein
MIASLIYEKNYQINEALKLHKITALLHIRANTKPSLSYKNTIRWWTGLKPSDYLTLNFTYQYHKMQTDLGEQSFYAKFNINPFTLAKELVIISPCNKVNNEAVIKQLEERAKTYARIYQDQ